MLKRGLDLHTFGALMDAMGVTSVDELNSMEGVTLEDLEYLPESVTMVMRHELVAALSAEATVKDELRI